jgi:hypothetical protein
MTDDGFIAERRTIYIELRTTNIGILPFYTEFLLGPVVVQKCCWA